MDPVTAWRAEHASFQKILALLQSQLDAFHRGEDPDLSIMADIVVYLRDYSDGVHHPREDVAFARLAAKRPELKLPIARLQQEHRVIAKAGEALREKIEGALGGAMLPRGELEIAAATYLVYYGNHIAKEEEDVIGAAGETLTAEDWDAVRKAVPDRADPVFGASPAARYAELRRRLGAG